MNLQLNIVKTMGNTHPKQNKNRRVLREKKIQENIHKTHTFTNFLYKNTQTSSTSITNLETASILHTINLQVERGDAPLNKNDLIAILVRLEPKYQQDITNIHKSLTVKDLIIIIRGIIYDVPTLQNTIEDKNLLLTV